MSDLNACLLRGLGRVPPDVDLIVGIPRSGLLAANLLALHLNLPLTDLDGLVEGRLIQSAKRNWDAGPGGALAFAKKVLVLDDSIMSGRAMRLARERVAKAKLSCQVLYGCVYVTPEARGEVDVWFEEIHGRRVFEWNLMRSKVITESCVDIDGVLCCDPADDDNDDGPRYLRFLAEAQPLLLPTGPVGYLVTSRLEKYRAETEAWLARHGVQYKKLYMLDLPDGATRRATKPSARFKAEIYAKTDSSLFIESSPRQAAEIARITGRPVLCVATRQMIYPSLAAHAPQVIRRAPSRLVRRLRRLLGTFRRRVLQFDPPRST